MNDANSIIADPRWLPFRYDHAGGSILFVRADREVHRATTFLDDQLLKLCPDRQQLSIQAVSAALQSVSDMPVHFIFHSAFCCSTLAARALDLPGVVMTLKEPLILNDITQAALSAGSFEAVRAPLAIALKLLARPFDGKDRMVVKPSNAANPLIAEILNARRTTVALFLTSELDEFLRSVAKKGLFGRVWARRQNQVFDRVPQFDPGFSAAEKWEQSDLQVAATGWLQQRVQFARLLGALPPRRAASLNSTDLLADPERTLSAVADLFGLNMSSEAVRSIAAGPVFRTNSKRHDQAFDASRRGSEHQAVGELIEEEITMVARWAHAVADHGGVTVTLGKPILSRNA